MMRGGRCSCTVAVQVEGGSYLMKGMAEKVEVGKIVSVDLESRVRQEVVEKIGLAASQQEEAPRLSAVIPGGG